MTTLQILALIWLALVFAVSLWQHINLGLIMIPAAFVLAEIAGVPGKSLYAGFPTKLVLLVLGVAFLWNHVQESGLADIFVTAMVRAARGRAFLLPWVMAFLTAVICAVGEGIDASLYDAAGVEHDRRGRLAATSTGVEGVWAAGDCRRGPATVVEAIADAAEVARAIADVDFNKYADCNEQAGREDTCYERKGSLCRDKRNCTKTRCLGCGSVCEVCCDVCPNRANVAIKVPGLAKHQVVHVDGMCNECGNCAVFCPYQEGRPYKDKLTLFWSEQDMENSENEGFLAVDEDHFKVRVAGTVRTVSVDAVNTGLPDHQGRARQLSVSP